MKKILIANRGEIALRIMKTAKKMGIQTVAIFSDADRDAPFVYYADEAVNIGVGPAKDSYLLGDKIISIAKKIHVDGIHPGYGFLAENAQFAEAVRNNGIIFIGPRSHAITVMGSKLAAKKTVLAYDIPMVPGTSTAIDDPEKAKAIAQDIGFPILIKASAGGGGKGMRIVQNNKEFDEQLERAMSEALSSFGDDSVFIEKFVTKPRHIEIQVLSDEHGNHIHLFERECSIQRRHQKVVEEAPSAVLTPEIRKLMGDAAVRVARSCNYSGAGTVEFLLDENNNFYFLEMNTRLQVEHPVTEWITGIDIVEEQIRIARGEPLRYQQEEIKMKGHAIELRVYSENPFDSFLPSIGTLETYRIPQAEYIRVDNGYREGQSVPIFYDPMLAKLVTYGAHRDEAIRHMLYAIDNFDISGVETTLPFGTFVMRHPAFKSGNFTTKFVDEYFSEENFSTQESQTREAAAIGAIIGWIDSKNRLRKPEVV